MNELQVVLIIIAAAIIVGLYYFQQQKVPAAVQKKLNPSHDSSLNQLKKGGSSSAKNATDRALLDEDELVIPDNQLGLTFGEEFEKPKEVVLEEENLKEIVGFTAPSALVSSNKVPKPTDDSPSFGSPSVDKKEIKKTKEDKKSKEIEPQVFALIVMGSDNFFMSKLNQTLHGVGLVLSDKGIFVKNDSNGNEIIRVANLLEPGTFSKEQLEDENLTSLGVVLILELPTSMKAPAVMHDMILMARKISQRLNARLYDINRQLIKESDLQKMRNKAIKYETSAI